MDGYDLASVRGLYSSLGEGWTYLNAHQHPQIPEMVAGRMATAFRQAPLLAPRQEATGSHTRMPAPGELYGDGFGAVARRAVADMVGGSAETVVLAPSIPLLVTALARACAPRLRRGSRLLASAGDSEWLTRPFAAYARDVRWIEPDVGSGRSAAAEYEQHMDGSVRLAVATAADPYTGIVGEISALADIVHQARAWLLIDASSYAPYRPVDIDHWDADIVLLDMGALGGPQVAAAIFRTEDMVQGLGYANVADLEYRCGLGGSVEPALLAGVGAVVDHYAGLSDAVRGLRRRRIAHSMGLLAEHYEDLMSYCVDSLLNIPAVHIVGISGETGDPYADHIARLSFLLTGVPAATVHQRLVANGVVCGLSPSTPLSRAMGVDEAGGAVTLSFSPFNSTADIDQLVRVLTSLR
ncbi:MAG: aminotransferase class V-fold PLP-dependent enzyme [Corynebacterium sp.]|nr:aminotransferase class V-fold PLP-dependent enzyme [Corynebacterium sp.]